MLAVSQANRATPRRARVVISCTECHRRKQKCDRKFPCNQCLSRGVEPLCRYTSHVSRGQDRHLPAASTTLKSAASSSISPGANHPIATSVISMTSQESSSGDDSYKIEHQTKPLIIDGGYGHDYNKYQGSSGDELDDYPLSDVESNASGSWDDEDDDETVEDTLGYFKSGVANIAQDIAELKLSHKLVSPTGLYSVENSKIKKTASKNSKIVSRLLRTMPPRPYVDTLVTIFYSEANFYQAINKVQFLESVENWWKLADRSQDIVTIALLFRVMSISLLFVPTNNMETIQQIDRNLENLSRDYSQAATELAALLPDSYEKVLESILRAAWLEYDSRMKESWYCVGTTIRMAQEIKMHVEEKEMSATYDRERRRRLWWLIYYWDRTMSLTLGRPAMILDEVCDVPLPLDLPDANFYPVVKPGPPVTEFTGRILSFKLGQYISDLDTDPLRLFRNLTIFTASLPAYFSIYTPDTSLDDQYPFLVSHRESIATSICMILCALYRRKVPIPNSLSFCLRLLTAAERMLSYLKENQYRQFMIVYQNLEPSMLMCREILKMSGRMAEVNFVLCDDGRGNIIDVWLCLHAVEGAVSRLRAVRLKNKIAAKAYRILKELVRRVKIQVDREKEKYKMIQEANAAASGSLQAQLSLGTPTSWPDTSVPESDEPMLDDAVLRILQHFDAVSKPEIPLQILLLEQQRRHEEQQTFQPVTPDSPPAFTSLPAEMICGKPPVRLPEPPSVNIHGSVSVNNNMFGPQLPPNLYVAENYQADGNQSLVDWGDDFQDRNDGNLISDNMGIYLQ
ncbi:fungal-specific transcription factor domain-containing protein [Lipomyces japonicus]|uniref:fungal-specific transcription factor domain-containing protein n=1 Tax=Lipomyces japonicus TaxID=56871 RepID=UPI0034CEC485